MQRKGILVTGGAGYIGSHVVRQLGEAGERIIVLDNLSTGFRSAVTHGTLVVGDTGDSALTSRLLAEFDIDTIMHFAAHTIVPESVSDPLKYYGNNTCASRNLLACASRHGIAHFIFSSTAAVYGTPDGGRAAEDSPTSPINPYGLSKLMTEWMLRDLSRASGLGHVTLRYFNVAGAHPGGRIGQSTRNATLLTKVACEVVVGKRPHVSVFGTDYDTPDGTGVRDYIHVVDLARGHLAALERLFAHPGAFTVNLGTGSGYSVLELVRAFEQASGRKVPYRIVDRRPGDIAACYADPSAAASLLGWRAALGIERMCADAWRWQQSNPQGYGGA